MTKKLQILSRTNRLKTLELSSSKPRDWILPDREFKVKRKTTVAIRSHISTVSSILQSNLLLINHTFFQKKKKLPQYSFYSYFLICIYMSNMYSQKATSKGLTPQDETGTYRGHQNMKPEKLIHLSYYV